MNREVDLSFPHHWTAEVLERRPLILPKRQFVYPGQVEEVELGALEALVRPASIQPQSPGATLADPFLATFALGFADPAAPSGLWSCPDPGWLCAVAGGYAYLIETAHPDNWQQVEYRPVLTVRAVVEQGVLLFAGHHAITAWGPDGRAWQSRRLSWEGLKIVDVSGPTLTGVGWDLMTDRDVEFSLDLRTGEHTTKLQSV